MNKSYTRDVAHNKIGEWISKYMENIELCSLFH